MCSTCLSDSNVTTQLAVILKPLDVIFSTTDKQKTSNTYWYRAKEGQKESIRMSLDRWQQLFFGIVWPSSYNVKPTGKAVTFHNKYTIRMNWKMIQSGKEKMSNNFQVLKS